MKLDEIVLPLQLRLNKKVTHFQGASFDSRTIEPQQMFVAIPGTQVDGHDYLAEARSRGAALALVEHWVDDPLPQLLCSNVRITLGEIASLYRKTLTMPVVGLTGSCGKTTTKMLIQRILAEVGRVDATQGTLNNDYGVPLTLLNIHPKSNFAVIEMGANHLHEIAYLTYMTRPNIALITNAGPVHLEGFGSIEGVAQGKGEIFQGLGERGLAIINLDDAFSTYWQQKVVGQPFLTFGLNPAADVVAKAIDIIHPGLIHFELQALGQSTSVALPLMGKHNVLNALAAATVAIGLGISLTDIVGGLAKATPEAMRLVRHLGPSGSQIIDDTYNANPLSMEMAMQTLMNENEEGIFVAGDMVELGVTATTLHYQLGEKAKRLGLKHLYTVGNLAQHISQGFGLGAQHFTDQMALIDYLKQSIQKPTTILIKGSRSAKMENVVKALILD